MTAQPVFLGTGRLAEPSEKTDTNTKILHPSESRGCWLAVYPTHLQIGDVKPGPTKHAKHLFGVIGGWVLEPLLGSLSSSSKSYNMLWEKISWVKFKQDRREIEVCGKREEDKHVWLVAFSCDQNEKLLRYLASYVKVEGSEGIPEEIAQPCVSSESKLNEVMMEDLHDYLNSIGFNAGFADLDRSFAYKGILKLNGANLGYVAKDTHAAGLTSEIIFLIEDVSCNCKGVRLVTKKKGQHVSELKWVGNNEQLVATLNQDQELMNQLVSEISNNNLIFTFMCHKTYHAMIGGKMMYKTKGKQSVTIHSFTQRLPSQEYFKAIDRLAGHVRKHA